MARLFFVLLSLGSLLTSQTAFSASTRCEMAFDFESPPLEFFQELLQIEKPETRAERKALRLLTKLDLSKPMSANDARAWVEKLFKAKYGAPDKYFSLWGDGQKVQHERLSRILQEEVGTQGLIKFLEDRSLVTDKDRFRTAFSAYFRKESTQIGLTGLSLLFALRGTMTPLMLPSLRLFKIEPREMEVLLLNGLNSPEGQTITKKLFPEMQKDRLYRLFQRTFNRVSIITAIVLTVLINDEQQQAEAEKNGSEFMKQINARLDQMEANSRLFDTRTDLEYDIVVAKLTQQEGRQLTDEELALVCTEIPAPRRCQNNDQIEP